MKIGYMGAHGTGKTTGALRAATLMEDTGVRVGVVTGVARSCRGPINRAASERTQRLIYHKHMTLEMMAEENYEAVYCDRTSLDSLVYAHVAGFTDLVRLNLPEAIEWLNSYSELFWARPREGWLVDDGKRDPDPGFQAEVDKVFGEWIAKYDLQTRVTELGADWE